MKYFKIGERVRVACSGNNACQFNNHDCKPRGVYDIEGWETLIFTIYGDFKKVEFASSPKVYGAYPLALDGKFVGYVYNEAIASIEPIKLDLNNHIKCILTESGANFLNEKNAYIRKDLYQKTYIPKRTVESMYKIDYQPGQVYKKQLWGLFRDFAEYDELDLFFTDLEIDY